MAYVIIDLCRNVKDGACIAVCPTDCIHPTPEELEYAAAEQLYIIPDDCIDCALCKHDCPVGAIFHEEQMPRGKEQFVQLNHDWFVKRQR